MKRLFFLSLLLVGFLPQQLFAQRSIGGQGRLQVSQWPHRAAETEAQPASWESLDLLPFLDTLTLEYRYFVQDERPAFTFDLAWHPAERGMFEGKEVPFSKLPPDVHLTAIDLEAGVLAGERQVGSFWLSLDSLWLAPYPDQEAITVTDIAWAGVFEGVSADSAQAYFDAGFTLRAMQVRRVAFGTYHADEEDAEASSRHRPRIFIYEPLIDIVIYRPVRGYPRYPTRPTRTTPADRDRRDDMGRQSDAEREDRRPVDRSTRGESDRGAGETSGAEAESGREVGRTDASSSEEGRSERGRSRAGKSGEESKGDDDDDDDDDDNKLVPAALVAGGAVVAMAVVGGTVGYYGNTEAPIGLMAGFVVKEGGFLLQASINEAVLRSEEPAYLLAKGFFFYDALKLPIQPGIGAGVRLSEQNDKIIYDPSFSVGAVGNFGPVVLFGGYDFQTRGVDFGLAINFRRLK